MVDAPYDPASVDTDDLQVNGLPSDGFSLTDAHKTTLFYNQPFTASLLLLDPRVPQDAGRSLLDGELRGPGSWDHYEDESAAQTIVRAIEAIIRGDLPQ